MIILYTNLLNIYKAEVALCFHLFPELRRQMIIPAMPHHHQKRAESFDIRVT